MIYSIEISGPQHKTVQNKSSSKIEITNNFYDARSNRAYPIRPDPGPSEAINRSGRGDTTSPGQRATGGNIPATQSQESPHPVPHAGQRSSVESEGLQGESMYRNYTSWADHSTRFQESTNPSHLANQFSAAIDYGPWASIWANAYPVPPRGWSPLWNMSLPVNIPSIYNDVRFQQIWVTATLLPTAAPSIAPTDRSAQPLIPQVNDRSPSTWWPILACLCSRRPR